MIYDIRNTIYEIRKLAKEIRYDRVGINKITRFR